MPSTFESALASIPGYGGWLAKERYNQQREHADVSQAAGLMQLLGAVTKQKQDAQLREVLAANGGDVEKSIAALIQAGNPHAARELAPILESQRKAAMEQKGQPIGSGGLRMPDGTIIPPAERPGAEKVHQPTTLARLLAEREALQTDDPRRAYFDDAIKKESQTARQIVPPIVREPAERGPRTINTAQGVLEYDEKSRSWKPIKLAPEASAPQTPGTSTPQPIMPASLAGAGNLSPQALSFTARQYLTGDRQAVQGYARNATARIALQNAIVDEAVKQGLNPEQVAAKMAEFAGTVAGSRTVGQRAANISLAATEAQEMIGIVKETSDKFARTNFVPWNMALKAYESGTGTPEIAAFGASVNALVNVYARAINPTGVPTVSDKEHARAVLNTVQSPAQVDAVLGIIRRELEIAKQAPAQVRSAIREGIAPSGKSKAEDFFR